MGDQKQGNFHKMLSQGEELAVLEFWIRCCSLLWPRDCLGVQITTRKEGCFPSLPFSPLGAKHPYSDYCS